VTALLALFLASSAAPAAPATPGPAVRLQAVATARIVAGQRIDFAATAEVPSAQRTLRLRQDRLGTPPQQLRLVEFQ